MAEHKSDDSKHTSKWGGGFVTSAQYLAELICENIAKKNKKNLFNRFWQTEAWEKTFQWQIICANRLLKKYHPSVLIKVLSDSQYKHKIISLGAIKNIEKELDHYQKEYDSKIEKFTSSNTDSPIEDKTLYAPPKPFTTKKESIINKLKGL